MNIEKVKFGDMPPQPFLLGLLGAFDNRYQAFFFKPDKKLASGNITLVSELCSF